jgi:predicted nicotinamide N-methyase
VLWLVVEDLDAALARAVAEEAERVGTSGARPSAVDPTPYHAVVWPAARGLAEVLMATPLAGRRVIELGCGRAVPSLVAARRGAHVLATDPHPEVGAVVARNATLNDLDVAFKAVDVRDPCVALHGGFDVVLVSDLLYDADLAAAVPGAVAKLLAPGGVALLSDPGRPALQGAVDALHGLGLRTETVIAGAPDEVFVVRAWREGDDAG